MTPGATQSTVEVADGRQVAYQAFGAPDGHPVVYFHGAGTSRLEAALFDVPAGRAGVRLIAIDRPGSGASSAHPARTLLSHADDALRVLDALGVAQAVSAGTSGGAMHAFALAHAAPQRVLGVVGIVPPFGAADPTFRNRLPRSIRLTSALARRFPGLVARMLAKRTAGMQTADAFRAGLRKQKGEDATVFDGELGQRFVDAVAEGGRRDIAWAADDFAILGRDWGFDPLAVTPPVVLVAGEHDPLRRVAERYAERRPTTRSHIVPGGHLGGFGPQGASAIMSAVVELSTHR